MPNATFVSFSKPPDFDSLPPEAFEYQAKVRQMTIPDFRNIIAEAPEEKDVWGNFVNFIAQYHADGTKRKSMFSAVIRAGHNIRDYDNTIWQRLASKYGNVGKDGEQNIAFPRDNIDLKDICFYWFENQYHPEKYNMDALREYFGMTKSGAHDAKVDVEQIGELIIRFMKLHRQVNVKFRGALASGAI